MSDSPETTQVVVTDSSPVARDDSNASDIPHADLLSALDKTPSTVMADVVSTQEVPEAGAADKEVVDVVSKDVPLQVAEDGLAGVEDSKVEGPAGTTLLATDGPAPIPPVQDTAVAKAEDVEDATVAKPTPVTVTEEEEARPEALSQEDTKEVASTLPTIEPTGANDTTQVDAEDKAVADAKEHDTIHLTSTEEDDTEAAPTDTITIPTVATIPELEPLDSNTAPLSSKDAIPTSELAEAKEDITIADPESTVQLVVPVDDVKPDFSGLEDGASQDELSSNQAENLPLQQGSVEGLLTDKDDQEPEIPIESEMTFAAPSSPILPAAKLQPPQEDIPALPQESEAAVAEPVVDTKDASPEAEAVPVVDQKAVEEEKDEEKPSLESVDSTIPVQDEPVADTTEDVITKDEPTSVDAESKDEPVPEKVEAEEAAPVVEATEEKPEEEASALDQDQPKVEAAAEETLEVTASVLEETAAPEPEEPVKEQQLAEAAAEAKPPADALEIETDAVAVQAQPTVEETPEEPVVEEEPQPEAAQKSAIDIATTTLDEKAEETVATGKDEVVDEVPSEAAAVPVETEQEAPIQVVVDDEKSEPEPVKVIEVEEHEPEPVKVEEEEKPAEVDESPKVEEPKAEEPIVEKSEPEAVPETREPEPEPVKAEEAAEVETSQEEEPLKVEEAVESAEPVSVEEHEEKAAEVKEVEQEPVNVEEPEEKATEPAESAEVIEKASAQAEEPQNAVSEVDQTATEPIKAGLWDAQTEQQPLKLEELEEKELVESELEQKPVETEALEKDLVAEAEPVREEPEQTGKAEEPEQVSETTADEDRPLTEPQLATHSITATDSSADSVDEPITPSVVVQNLEAVETSGDDEVEHTAEPAVATGEIERPKSPWTPSFTVSTLGGPVAEQDDVEDDLKPEQAVVSLLVTDDDGKVQAPEESTPAPPARPWTPSYSVHSQGNSPVLKPVELEDEVPEAPARPWTPSYSVHSQGNSPIQKPIELEDEVPEAPLAKEAETPSLVPPVDEVAAPQPAEVPVSTQPIVESTTHEDAPSEDVEVPKEQSARVDNADSPVLETASAPEEDTGTVEKTTVEPIADTTLASNVDTVGSDEVSPVVPNEVNTETAGVDEVENKVGPVSKASEEPEESTSAATPETDEAASETPKLALVEENPAEEAAVPSVGESLGATDVDIVSPVPLVAPVPVVGSSTWVPSYSVSRQGSRQGSPLPRPQDTVEDDGATVAKESAPAAEVVEDTVQKDLSAISETETNAISAPAGGQEAVPRSWTPSYSVTTQGPIAEPDLSAAQDGNASSAAPEEPEPPIASDIEELQASGPTPETLKEAVTNGAAVAAEDAEPESSSGVSPTHETPVVASTSDPLETRKRLESTASSRFFPGSWFSAAAKPPVPEEGRASLETASGQFSRGPSSPLDTGAVLSPITINTENLAVPEGEHTEDSAVSPSKRKWCSIM